MSMVRSKLVLVDEVFGTSNRVWIIILSTLPLPVLKWRSVEMASTVENITYLNI